MEILLTDALAAYRLTRLVVDDTILDRPRAHLTEALRVGGYDKAIEGLTCTWCVSVWAAAGVTLARRAAPRLWAPVAAALAASAIAGKLAE